MDIDHLIHHLPAIAFVFTAGALSWLLRNVTIVIHLPDPDDKEEKN